MSPLNDQDLLQHDSPMNALSSSPSFDQPLPRRRKGRGVWIVIILLALAAIGGWGYRQGWFGTRKPDATAQYQNVMTVQRGDIEDVVTSQGKLEPKEYVDVGAQVSGQLKKIYVELGDVVKQGDLIAEIDPEILQTRVNGDQARLKTLQAQLAEQDAQIVFAQQQYDRNQNLIKQDAVSKEVLQNSEADLKAAQARAASYRAQIEEAQSTLHGDQVNLKFTKIYAPMDGTVVVQSAREGQTLNAVQSAPVIVQLAKLSTMTVRAQVAEADVTRIKPDMNVYFTILGNMERRWQGQVRQILPSPEIVNEVVLYNVLIDVNNDDNALMNGMTTQVFFVIGQAKNVLTLPATALGKAVPDQDQGNHRAYTVRVPDGKKGTEKIIHVGMMSRAVVEVIDGLQEGDKVLPPADAKPADSDKAKAGAPRMGPRL